MGTLRALGIVSLDSFDGLKDLAAEWRVVKKAYFGKVRLTHPDKGGDAAAFRNVQTAFEVLHALFKAGDIASFTTLFDGDSDEWTPEEDDSDAWKEAWARTAGATPSWDYYAAAEAEVNPIYRVELAKSSRSKCKHRKCPGEAIAKGAIRIGSLDAQAGSYTRWVHLACWRVPCKIWLGLRESLADGPRAVELALLAMNDVLLCGFATLSDAERGEIVRHVMEKATPPAAATTKKKKKPIPQWKTMRNWANAVTCKACGALGHNSRTCPGAAEESAGQPDGTSSASASASASATSIAVAAQRSSATALVSKAKARFVIPVPGKDGVANILAGKTVVLTGVFPELGGGGGLSLGKARAKAMIQSFGGRVTGSVSGRTDILLVGKSPGFSKVSKARAAPKARLVTLDQLRNGLVGTKTLEDATAGALQIGSFSSGYNNNGLKKQRIAGAQHVAAMAMVPAAAPAAPAKAAAVQKKAKKATAKAAKKATAAAKKAAKKAAKEAEKKKKKATKAAAKAKVKVESAVVTAPKAKAKAKVKGAPSFSVGDAVQAQWGKPPKWFSGVVAEGAKKKGWIRIHWDDDTETFDDVVGPTVKARARATAAKAAKAASATKASAATQRAARKRVRGAAETAMVVAPAKRRKVGATAAAAAAALSSLRVVDLRAQLAAKGWSTKGRKAELVARLRSSGGE